MHPWLSTFLQLSDAVIITDDKHVILEVNATYERITGYTRAEVAGRKAGLLKAGLTPKLTYDHLKQTLESGHCWSGIFTNRNKNRELWHSSITITPFDLEGATYYVGVFRDLDQLERGQYIAEERIEAVRSSLFRVLAISSEIRDPAIEEHLNEVQRLTKRLLTHVSAHELYKQTVTREMMHDLIHTSILHDVGKAMVPEGILYKPGSLTAYERQIIEMHPLMGVDILNKIRSELEDELDSRVEGIARNIILYHHERWDGTGYPHGLRGTEIPLEARIVAIVDVYDALTSKRAYKEAWPASEAAAYILGHKGTHFDPVLADIFVSECCAYSRAVL